MRFIYYDVEVLDNLQFIGVLEDGSFCINFYYDPKPFLSLVREYRDAVFVGYNCWGYDNIVIGEWANGKDPVKVTHDIIVKKKYQGKMQRISGVKNIDLMTYYPTGSLKVNAYMLGFKYSEYGALESDDVNIVRQYNKEDLAATKLLLEHKLDYIKCIFAARDKFGYQKDNMIVRDTDLANKFLKERIRYNRMFDIKRAITRFPDQDIAKPLLELCEEDVSDRPITREGTDIVLNKGGIHYSACKYQYDSSKSNKKVYNIDFSSFYPIIYAGNGIFTENSSDALRKMIKDRIELKGKDPVAAQANKIVLNSLFGRIKFSNISNIDTYSITSFGQYIILELLDFVRSSVNCNVLDINTDGLLVVSDETNWDKYFLNSYFVSDILPDKLPVEIIQLDLLYYKDFNNYYYKDNLGNTKSKGSWISNKNILNRFNIFDASDVLADPSYRFPTKTLIKRDGVIDEYHLTEKAIDIMTPKGCVLFAKDEIEDLIEQNIIRKEESPLSDTHRQILSGKIRQSLLDMCGEVCFIPIKNKELKSNLNTLNKNGFYTVPKVGKIGLPGITSNKHKEASCNKSHNYYTWKDTHSKANGIGIIPGLSSIKKDDIVYKLMAIDFDCYDEQGLLPIENQELKDLLDWANSVDTMKCTKKLKCGNIVLTKVLLYSNILGVKFNNKRLMKALGVEILNGKHIITVYSQDYHVGFENPGRCALLDYRSIPNINNYAKESTQTQITSADVPEDIQMQALQKLAVMGFIPEPHPNIAHAYISKCPNVHAKNAKSKCFIVVKPKSIFIDCAAQGCEYHHKTIKL